MTEEEKKEWHYSHTSMSSWRRCRLQFYLKYVEGYSTVATGKGQMTGLIGHAALAYWYKQPKRLTNYKIDDKAVQVAWDRFWEESTKAGVEPNVDDFSVAENALKRYFDWARDNDGVWDIIASELEFKMRVGGYPVIGFIDLVVREKGHVWLVEHKFYKQVSTSHLDLDPQVSTYMLGAFTAGYNPVGVIYNMIRTTDGPTAKKEPVVRRRLYRNPDGLAAKAKEMVSQMEEMSNFLENGGNVYRSETHDCHWDCPFYHACLSITDTGTADEVLSQMDKNPSRFAGDEYEDS